MAEELFFATDSIDGIILDVIVSNNGVREILINKKQTPKSLNNAIQISPDDPKVLICL